MHSSGVSLSVPLRPCMFQLQRTVQCSSSLGCLPCVLSISWEEALADPVVGIPVMHDHNWSRQPELFNSNHLNQDDTAMQSDISNSRTELPLDRPCLRKAQSQANPPIDDATSSFALVPGLPLHFTHSIQNYNFGTPLALGNIP